MAESTILKNHRDSTILIEDGTGTPLNYTVAYEPGDVNFDSGKDEISVYYDRGTVCGVRKNQQGLPSGSFSVFFRDLTDGSDTTLTDILDNKGAYAAGISTLGAGADVYTVKLTFTIAEPGLAAHTISFDDCYCTWSFAEGDPSTVSVNWTCHGAVAQT